MTYPLHASFSSKPWPLGNKKEKGSAYLQSKKIMVGNTCNGKSRIEGSFSQRDLMIFFWRVAFGCDIIKLREEC